MHMLTVTGNNSDTVEVEELDLIPDPHGVLY